MNDLLEIELKNEDDFLKVKETLTRIGVASSRTKTLYQSCHILHKRGRYFIVHFKELFALDGKSSSFGEEDRKRRNRVASLLAQWNLVKLVKEISDDEMIPIPYVKIIAFKDKGDWNLESKYEIGKHKRGG